LGLCISNNPVTFYDPLGFAEGDIRIDDKKEAAQKAANKPSAVKPAPLKRASAPTQKTPTPPIPKISAPAPKPEYMQPRDRIESGASLEELQQGLEIAGYYPFLGSGAEVTNAAIYLAQGEYVDAGLCILGGVPIVGKFIKTSVKATKTTKAVVKNLTEGKGSKVRFGSDTKSSTKLSSQMSQRGWTESTVRDTVSNPFTTRASTNLATGNSATAYYNQRGGYVIIDDVTNAVVQVGDNINPSSWIPDPNIINPFIP